MQPRQIKDKMDKIVESMLYSTRLTLSIAEIIGNMRDRAVVEYHLLDMKEASTTPADHEAWIKRLLPRHTSPSKVPPTSEPWKISVIGVAVTLAHTVALTAGTSMEKMLFDVRQGL